MRAGILPAIIANAKFKTKNRRNGFVFKFLNDNGFQNNEDRVIF